MRCSSGSVRLSGGRSIQSASFEKVLSIRCRANRGAGWVLSATAAGRIQSRVRQPRDSSCAQAQLNLSDAAPASSDRPEPDARGARSRTIARNPASASAAVELLRPAAPMRTSRSRVAPSRRAIQPRSAASAFPRRGRGCGKRGAGRSARVEWRPADRGRTRGPDRECAPRTFALILHASPRKILLHARPTVSPRAHPKLRRERRAGRREAQQGETRFEQRRRKIGSPAAPGAGRRNTRIPSRGR